MLSSYIQQWIGYLRQRCTPQTVDKYIDRIEHYNQSITHIPQTPSDIEKFITNFAVTHKPSTTNAHLVAIKSFYKWAETFNLENPTAKVHFLKEGPRKVRCLSPKEYEFVLQFSQGALHKTIQFLGNTGLRESEFRHLTWQDFSSDLRFVHINGKGRKLREVPLNDVCRELLNIPHTGTQPEFLTPFKQPTAFYFHCCILADRVKIPHFGSHAIRHFFATRLVNSGAPLAKVSRILGHANTLITERTYLHLCPADLEVTDCLRF